MTRKTNKTTYSKALIIVPLLIALFIGPGLPAQGTSGYYESQVRAIFLEKFTKFIEWPKDSGVENLKKPFIIGVIGYEAELTVLKEVYGKQLIKKKKVQFLTINNVDQITGCNLLYIVDMGHLKIDDVIAAIKNKPILSVSTIRSLIHKGIHISLYFKRQKTRFDVNEKALKSTPLEVHYHLYTMASMIVNPVRQRRR